KHGSRNRLAAVGFIGWQAAPVAAMLVLVDDVAVAVDNAQDRGGWDEIAAVGEDAEGLSQFQWGEFATAQRERQAILRRVHAQAVNADALGEAQERIDTDLPESLHRRDVVRIGEGIADAHRAMKLPVIIAGR